METCEMHLKNGKLIALNEYIRSKKDPKPIM